MNLPIQVNTVGELLKVLSHLDPNLPVRTAQWDLGKDSPISVELQDEWTDHNYNDIQQACCYLSPIARDCDPS